MEISDLTVKKRDLLGSAAARRYRRAGNIPCVLYGHKQECVPLLVEKDDFEAVLEREARIVRLRLGEEEQAALVRDVAWDLFGEGVDHVDFVRVDLAEEVEVTVPVHFAGTPAGAANGGVLEEILSDIEVRCRADAIPSEIRVDISGLRIGDGVHVRDLVFPEGVRHERSDDDLVIHVVPPRKAEEEPVVEEEAAEAGPEEGQASEASEKAKAGKERE